MLVIYIDQNIIGKRIMKESSNSKGLSRIDSESTHGWFVRGYKNKKTYSKLFSDKKYGGKAESLEAASKYRDALAEELKEIPSEPRPRRVVTSDIRNSTGVLGVCRISKKTASGGVSESYSVTWRPEPGVQKCSSFSIRKYGEKEAFRLAVELRRKQMAEIFGEEIREVKKRVKQRKRK